MELSIENVAKTIKLHNAFKQLDELVEALCPSNSMKITALKTLTDAKHYAFASITNLNYK